MVLECTNESSAVDYYFVEVLRQRVVNQRVVALRAHDSPAFLGNEAAVSLRVHRHS